MAGLALPIVSTLAVEVVHQVNTVSAILTWVVSALIDVEVTELTLPAVQTEALKGVHPVDAGPSVSAGVADAVINIFMTVHATETQITDAGEVACWLTDALTPRTTDIR